MIRNLFFVYMLCLLKKIFNGNIRDNLYWEMVLLVLNRVILIFLIKMDFSIIFFCLWDKKIYENIMLCIRYKEFL